MFDLLTIEEDKEAADLGWSLNYVYNVAVEKWAVQILPLVFAKPFDHAEAVALKVVHDARVGHALSIKALRFMAAPIKPKGRKK